MNVEEREGGVSISPCCRRVPALFVAVEAPIPGRFDDNWFTLLPGREKLIRFTPAAPSKISSADFTVRDLFTATCKA